MDHLSAAGSSATRNLTTTEPSESLNRRKTVDFRFQRPHATSRSFFFNKPMRAMDSRRDFTSKKVFSGYFSELGEKANSALTWELRPSARWSDRLAKEDYKLWCERSIFHLQRQRQTKNPFDTHIKHRWRTMLKTRAVRCIACCRIDVVCESRARPTLCVVAYRGGGRVR